MCLNAEFWAGLQDKGGAGGAVVGSGSGGSGGEGGSGFIDPCSTSGLQGKI